ncbi:MAG: hypothetical protein Q8Q54_08220 [Methylococcales bacterium]|nr:hypothetical protein [Methylococcales bacterium]MDP3838890.1 hypothetical protein [Methylococcales bacterium]
MKCIKCGKDAKKQDRKDKRCPSCHHRFVTEPTEDGLTDMAIKSAEEAVSSHGTFYFSKDHLKYQLQRKLRKQQRVYTTVSMIALCIFIAALLLTFIKGGFFFGITAISGFVLLIVSTLRSKHKKTIKNLDVIVNKWVTINPHEKLLTADKYQASFGSRNSDNLDDISFDRVLICERNDTVDFFLSNLFHFHYSCPVLGGNGYPQAICDDMLKRLKQNPNLKVFLLHDYTPAGQAFVRRIKTDPKWFGDGRRYDIVDLGLNVGQKKLFKEMTIKKADRNQKIKETAEVSLFQPAALITLCGVAINEAVPLDLVTTAAAADNSGSTGGYG